MPVIVPGAVRTMALFEVFAREKRELSNKELARLMDLPESSMSDLVYTLHQLGYVTRTAKSRRYFPSPRLRELIFPVGDDKMLAAAQEVVDVLSGKTQETCFFGRYDSGAVHVLAVKEGSHALRFVLNAGERFALHASAMGKAILSLLPPEEARRELHSKPLRKVTSSTVIDPHQLESEIESYRESHIATVHGEGVDGVTAYGIAGMLDMQPVAFSLAGPADRFNDNAAQYKAALVEVAEKVFGLAP